MLPPAHRDAITASLRRGRLLYGVAFVGVALELSLGLYVWLELSPLGPMPGRDALPWLLGLALAALIHLAAARWVHRRLRRPEALLGRLNVALAKAEPRARARISSKHRGRRGARPARREEGEYIDVFNRRGTKLAGMDRVPRSRDG